MKNIDLSHYNADFWQGYVVGGVIWVLGFLVDIQHFIYLILLLVIVDMITGVISAHKRKEKVVSRKLARTVEKFVIYLLAIISAHAVKVVILEAAPITYIVASSIVLVEFKSIIENVETVTDVDAWGKIKHFFNTITKNKNGKN